MSRLAYDNIKSPKRLKLVLAQLAGAVEYTDSISTGVGVKIPSNECPGYNTKQFHGEAPVMLELWGMWSTPSLSLLPGPQNCLTFKLSANKWFVLNWIVRNRTVWSFNCV